MQVNYVESNGAPGTVVKQTLNNKEISEGKEIKEGMVVTLDVSNGNNSLADGEVTVPEFTGLSYSEALELASTNNLYICVSGDELNEEQQKGLVLSQDIESGQVVSSGQIIKFTRSAGNKITVPNFKLKSSEEVEKIAKKNHVTYKLEYVESDSVAKDHVVEQSVEAGKRNYIYNRNCFKHKQRQ